MCIFLFVSFSEILPQYSKADGDLVKTTFTREFNPSIINRYLRSGNPLRVKAALLSIAQSEDTSWVPQVITLSFSKYGKEICFALWELGACSNSTEYLLDKIRSKNTSRLLLHDALASIGQVGNLNSLNQIEEYYKNSGAAGIPGISLAIYYYYSRGIADKTTADRMILNEIQKHKQPSEEYFEAAFALFRTFVPDSIKDILTDDLRTLLLPVNINKRYAPDAVSYLLGCLRKLHFFPEDYNLLNQLLDCSDYSIKVETAHSLIYYNFGNEKELGRYLALLDDANNNISRTAASSLKDIKLTDKLKSYLENDLEKRLKENGPHNINRDELFLSYIKLFPDSFENMENIFGQQITRNCLYDACTEFDSSNAALNFLLNNYRSETNKNRINILQSLISFQNKFSYNEQLSHTIIGAINSNYPPLIATASDGIDSGLIKSNLDTLKSIIPLQIEKYKDNPDFQESIMSLTMLSKNVDTSLYNSVLNQLTTADYYAIKKFGYKLARKAANNLLKGTKYFDVLWQNAFKYKKAEIITGKGKFTIELLPQYAPVTAGNFTYLAEMKVFNNNPFHRVVPGFVIQGGDPEETGWGGPGYDIVSEFSPLTYIAGMVGMASAGKDTEGSQWFVTTGNFPHLNGRYTIFAKILNGINIIRQIEQNDKVIRVKLI
jgi:cyclophilin family peptidyl-prolyl cis-trans isomerase